MHLGIVMSVLPSIQHRGWLQGYITILTVALSAGPAPRASPSQGASSNESAASPSNDEEGWSTVKKTPKTSKKQPQQQYNGRQHTAGYRGYQGRRS